ncbi:hypothetical protein RRG08_039996 [Elysia crispata]|uniref:Uncharacterized protein n=1 Tax=Elysia crispata TaxID=231223 RepID=A0AAE1DC15_9GAST|nr:hypothetical protein RRG08_039996 [Elysia crispata]
MGCRASLTSHCKQLSVRVWPVCSGLCEVGADGESQQRALDHVLKRVSSYWTTPIATMVRARKILKVTASGVTGDNA